MRKFCQSLAVLCLLLAPAVFAQTTTVVSGTVTDPNGLPYALGTIQPILSASGTPLIAGQPYIPPSTPTSLDSTGSFSVLLARNGSISPGGSTWGFTVCSAKGSVSPAFGKGSVCFAVTGITVAGATQSITTQLTAAALALTNASSVVAAPCGADTQVQFNNSGACGASPGFTFDKTLFALYSGQVQASFDPTIQGYFGVNVGVQGWQVGAGVSGNPTGIAGAAQAVGQVSAVGAYGIALSGPTTAGNKRPVAIGGDSIGVPNLGVTLNEVLGFNASATNAGAGLVTALTGSRVSAPTNSGGGTATNAYGYAVDPQQGVATNSFGYYAPDAGSGASDYGFYSAGGKSLFDLRRSLHNCQNAASPAVCVAATTGSVALAAAGTTLVVNTTAVTANSQILLTRDDSLGTLLSVTCNTQSSLVLGAPRVSARTAATSFTITVDVGPTTNPMCISYSIVN